MDALLRRRQMMTGGGSPTPPPPPVPYIQFVDPVVEQICATRWGDGVGLTEAQAAAVTTIPDSVFGGNTSIVHFPELRYFTGLNYQYGLRYYAFDGCSSLEDVTLPKGIYLEAYTFRNCSSFSTLKVYGSGVFEKSGDEFEGCTNLTEIYGNDIEQIMTLVGSDIFNYNSAPFRVSGGGHIYVNNVEVIDVVIPGTVTSIPYFGFHYCTSIQSVDIPSGVTQIKRLAFDHCTALKTVVIRATTPPTMESYTFWNNDADRVFYVPYSADHSVLNAYLAAGIAEWTSQTVFELNPDGTIPS